MDSYNNTVQHDECDYSKLWKVKDSTFTTLFQMNVGFYLL